MAKIPKFPKPIPKKLPAKQPPYTPQRPPPPPPPASRPSPYTPRPSAFRPQPPPPARPQAPVVAEKELKKRTRVRRWGRTFPLIVLGLTSLGLGMYASQLWISLANGPPSGDIPEDVSGRFDKEADGYDEKVNTAEFLLRLKSRRKELTKMSHGHVLEVAAGTGRNIPYYPTKKCATVTLLDQSAPMLAIAKRKWNDTHMEYFSRVFFKQQSALDPITPPYGAQDGYDTVLQTMGLCSTPEPVKLLQNLEACTKEDGQILLLEHGKSHWQWLNSLLDKTAPAHADEHGCWWNKDIGKIVEESGLEVVKLKRYNFGTTWWVELRPRKGIRRKLQLELEKAKRTADVLLPTTSTAPVAQKPWWSLWR